MEPGEQGGIGASRARLTVSGGAEFRVVSLVASFGGMPIYEYRCPKGHLFERMHGFSDHDPAGCDICGEGPVEKVLYPVAVHFKGSGFYSTDYGRGARKRDGAKEGEGGTGADGAGTSEPSGGEKPASGGDKPPADKKPAEA